MAAPMPEPANVRAADLYSYFILYAWFDLIDVRKKYTRLSNMTHAVLYAHQQNCAFTFAAFFGSMTHKKDCTIMQIAVQLRTKFA